MQQVDIVMDKRDKTNKLRYYKNVRELAMKNHCGRWKETWAKWVYPVYPMTYEHFIKIMHMDIDKEEGND